MEALFAFLVINVLIGLVLLAVRHSKMQFLTVMLSLLGTNAIIIASDFFIR